MNLNFTAKTPEEFLKLLEIQIKNAPADSYNKNLLNLNIVSYCLRNNNTPKTINNLLYSGLKYKILLAINLIKLNKIYNGNK